MSKPRKAAGSGHIRTRTLKSGEHRFDVLVPQAGKQVLLVAAKELGEAEATLLEWALKRQADGKRVPDDIGVVTVRALGQLYVKALPDHRRAERQSIVTARVNTAAFADISINQLSEMAVRRWIDSMAREPIASGKSKGRLPSRSTLQNALNTLRDMLRYGIIKGLTDRNVAKNVTIRESTIAAPHRTAKGQGYDYLREAEVKRILDCPEGIMPAKQRCAFTLLAFTGARPKDLYLLTWDRVDVPGARIVFRTHKKNRDYTAHLLPPALDAIRKLWMHAGQPVSGLVFPGQDGRPHARGYDWGWTTTSSKKRETPWPGYRERAGIRRKTPLYSLRHTCASNLLLGSPLFTGGRRWSLEEIRCHLGHADMSTVETYAVSLNIASMQAVEESRVALRKLKK